MGESGLGIHFEDADLAQALGFAALVVILAEGGLTTKWSDIRSSVGLAALLATVGVGISVGLMTLFGYYVLGLDLWIAVLLGAVTSPTDSAAVFSVLRNVPIPHRLRGVLEAESGLNDAPTVLLVSVASSLAVGQEPAGGAPGLVGLIVLELVGGLAVGVALGWLGVQVLRRVALPSSGLYPLAALVWAVFDLRQPRRRCTPAASPRSTSAPWCWATPSCRTGSRPARSSRASAGSPRSGSS